MKQDRISLIERAAEVYDFGAALRARSPAPLPDAVSAAAAPASPRLLEPGEIAAELAAAVHAPAAAPAGTPARRSAVTATIDRAGLAAAGYLVPNASVTGLAEEFRLLKRQLLAGMDRRRSMPDEKRRSVLITSAQPQEGKSFCAVNLALSLAGESELEVLLVDGDFTKPDMLSILGIEGGHPGLVDALVDCRLDPEALVIGTDVPGLSVLPAGMKVNNVPELLASDRTREVLTSLAAGNRQRIILFDSPPALMASPATILAGQVGQVLVVVRADRTPEADLRETIGLLAGCDHLSLILNGAALAVSGRNFGAYYGQGHDD